MKQLCTVQHNTDGMTVRKTAVVPQRSRPVCPHRRVPPGFGLVRPTCMSYPHWKVMLAGNILLCGGTWNFQNNNAWLRAVLLCCLLYLGIFSLWSAESLRNRNIWKRAVRKARFLKRTGIAVFSGLYFSSSAEYTGQLSSVATVFNSIFIVETLFLVICVMHPATLIIQVVPLWVQ